MKKAVIIMMLIAIGIFAVACKETKPGDSKKAGSTATNASGPYIAKVNETPITVDAAKAEFEMLQPEVREYFNRPGGAESLAQELAKKEMLYQEAKKQNYMEKPEFLRKLEEFKKRLSIEMLLEEKVMKSASVTDEDVKNFYEKNKKDFVMEVPGEKKPRELKLDQVARLIKERLTSEKQKEKFDTFIEEMKKTYKMELNKTEIGKLANTIAPTKGAIGNAPVGKADDKAAKTADKEAPKETPKKK